MDPATLKRDYLPRLEQNLTDNILPFWTQRAVDPQFDGYQIEWDHEGRLVAGASKGLVSQCRLTWLFARLCRSDYRQPEHLELARRGYEFIRGHLYDDEYGGFYWEVDQTGREKRRTAKHLYGQAFAIFALSEYYGASGDPRALELADHCIGLVERHGHDAIYGGYQECFERDWSPIAPGRSGYLGIDAAFKSMNTHLHLLEALTCRLRVGAAPLVHERIVELIGILSNAVLAPDRVACLDVHARDWSAIAPESANVSYGHDLENVWLLLDACEAIGDADRARALVPTLQRLVEYSLEFGYDRRRGGFFEHGPLSQRATSLDKVWWVQAEALVCCLLFHGYVGDARYLAAFAGTWEFVERYQVDERFGEWHERIRGVRPTRAGKGHHWKAGYHNGRAMFECIARLKAL